MRGEPPRWARVALVVILVALAASMFAPAARAQGGRILLAEITDVIDRSTLEYMTEAIGEAEAGGYAALVVRLDTPGGGLDETIAISNLMLRSRLPVLGFVGPVGASAVSAGTVLLMSTDLAAMAPGTTIGSVQPVVFGPSGFEPVTEEKIVGFVVATLKERMAFHGRNVSLADKFVRENWNLNATEALRLNAIEIVAASVSDFLAQADGKETFYKRAQLAMAGAEIDVFSPSVRVGFLAVLSDPLVSSLLLILGIYLIIFGLTAPGHGAEIAGIILLLLAIVGLGFSVDPIALLLIVIGVILLIVELKTPGFGAFGIGGIIAIVIGAVFLAPLRPPRFVVSPEYQTLFLTAFLTPTASLGAFLLFAMYKVMEVRRRKPTIGEMVGETAVSADAIRAGETGYVRYRGELWQAVPMEDVPPDVPVYIHALEGIILRVSTSPPPPPPPPKWKSLLAKVLRRGGE